MVAALPSCHLICKPWPNRSTLADGGNSSRSHVIHESIHVGSSAPVISQEENSPPKPVQLVFILVAPNTTYSRSGLFCCGCLVKVPNCPVLSNGSMVTIFCMGGSFTTWVRLRHLTIQKDNELYSFEDQRPTSFVRWLANTVCLLRRNKQLMTRPIEQFLAHQADCSGIRVSTKQHEIVCFGAGDGKKC